MARTITMLSIDQPSLTTTLDRAGYRKMGVSVLTASSGSQAFDILKQKDIDVVVINLDFVALDAAALCKQLRHLKKSKTLPIVVTSVQTNAIARNAMIEAGANLYVEQPVPRPVFIEQIKELLSLQVRGDDRHDPSNDSEVKIRYEANTFSYPIADLSPSGMLISADEDIPIGAVLELEFEIPSSPTPLKAKGEVVRQLKPTAKQRDQLSGIGVRFLDFQKDGQKRLQQYLDNQSVDQKKMQYYL